MDVEGDNKLNLIKEGFNLIFKKWSSFRMALDHNPRVLTQYADDEQTVLEIAQMMGFVYEDIYKELKKENGSKIAQVNIADILACFIDEFFGIDLQDGSEEQVSKCLCLLYKEIESNKKDYLERLRINDKTINYGNYNISFPIKPEEKIKVIASELEDMDIDDGDSDDMDCIDEEEEGVESQNTQNTQNNTQNNIQNNQSSQNKNNQNEPDEEGFVVVKKGKKY
jgi:ABC-type antimicrobial peptide transport system permease subunit